jgi:S-DNA-T family DNA segregation ATPase FtsK/SpoIIIE
VPGQLPAGRAVWAGTGEEIQVAFSDAATAAESAARLRRRWAALPARHQPRRVDPLPERVTVADVVRLAGGSDPGRDVRPAPAAEAGSLCTPAVGGDDLGPVDVDLADLGATFVVAGPARSGRSTALLAVVETLRGRFTGELPVIAVTPRGSPVRGLAGRPGVLAVLHGEDEAATHLEDEVAAAGGRTAVVVDDAELLRDGPATDLLERFARTARDSGSLLIAAATTEDLLANRFRGWLARACRARAGLLLTPTSNLDGEVFELRLPRSTGGGWPPGRALLVARGRTAPVQVLDAGRATAVSWPPDARVPEVAR